MSSSGNCPQCACKCWAEVLSCRHFTFPTILSASWYRLGCFFLTFPPPTLAFCVCKLKNVRKYKSMEMFRFKLCRGQNSFGPDGSHRAVTTSSLLRVDRLKWVTFPQPATETWVLSAAHVLSISSGYSVWVLGHLNHFVFYDRCAFFSFREAPWGFSRVALETRDKKACFVGAVYKADTLC